MPEPRVRLCRLGHEVDHAVQRLERPPRLARPQRAVVAHSPASPTRRSASDRRRRHHGAAARCVAHHQIGARPARAPPRRPRGRRAARPGSPSRRACSVPPPGRRRARPRRRRSTPATPRRGPGTAPSPGSRPGKPEIPTMASPRSSQPDGAMDRPSVHGPGTAHGRVALAGRLVRHHADQRSLGVEHADAGGVEGHAPVRVGRAVDRIDHGQETRRPVPRRPRLLGEHRQPAPCSTGSAAPSAARSRRYWPGCVPGGPPVVELVERGAHGARRPRRAPRAAERRPRGHAPYRATVPAR